MGFRVLRIKDDFVSLVIHVCYFRRPTSSRVVLSVLVRWSIPSFRDDLYRMMGRFFLFRHRFLGSKGLVAWCLWIYGLFRYVVGFVYLDDYYFNSSTQ